MLLHTPNIFNSQITKIIITATFNIFFIVGCMGMYEFTSQSKTPATTKTTKIVNIGMMFILWVN